MGRPVPEFPTLFTKFADTLTGADSDIKIPSYAADAVDWEAELAVIVGAELSNASREEATEGIAGYTVANDISMRSWQQRTGQWLSGKAFDATTPIGPAMVPPGEVNPVAGLTIRCAVNGVERQVASTADLVFDAANLLSYISTFTTLRPGDIVLTGTPGGVGTARNPPMYLADGDVIETSIEGIGTLRNRVCFVEAQCNSIS
nr:fumarylacetoacetate hydrolase family protein [Rhodococcus erythropolis]